MNGTEYSYYNTLLEFARQELIQPADSAPCEVGRMSGANRKKTAGSGG